MRNEVSTDGDMTISNANGQTVYRSNRDIYVNGKNVGRTYTRTNANGGNGSRSIVAGGKVTSTYGGKVKSKTTRSAAADARADRAADRADRAQDKLHRKMYGY
jgi:hypothetical protein